MSRILGFVLLTLFLLIPVPLHAAPPAYPAQATGLAPVAAYDWLQFNFDTQHSGNNPSESTLTAANVNQLQKLFQVALPTSADGAPVYLANVTTSQGVKNLIFATTRSGRLVARNAITGAAVWSKQYGPGTCTINRGATPCYTTSSPVLNPNRQYVYSYGLDGKVHRFKVGTGTEVTGNGFPALATRKGWNEKGSSALSLATAANGHTYLYVTNGGYPGDAGDYQGHVTAIDLTAGTQKVFNTVCSNRAVHFFQKPSTPDCSEVQTAIWARPGVIYSSATDKIYMATGNGTFNPGQYFWGDTVFSLNPNGTSVNGLPVDSYTPTNYQDLQDTDTDIGSTAPAILPVPGNSVVQHLAVQSGKDAKLRLLNLDNLSGQGAPGNTGGEIGAIIDVPQGGEVLTQPAVWVNPADSSTWVFVANDNGISGLKLTVDGSGNPALQPQWQIGNGGTSPILANGVLYYAGSGGVWALDPTTGNTLWNDTQIGWIHWSSPIVANGVLYITDMGGQLTAYSLNGVAP
ncbi:MAG: PQQ-binding-like beta-propeller repeat protein [Anaerolineae bacterium]